MNCHSFLQEHFLYYLQKHLSDAGVATVISTNPLELVDGEESLVIEVSHCISSLVTTWCAFFWKCVCVCVVNLFQVFYFSFPVAVGKCG